MSTTAYDNSIDLQSVRALINATLAQNNLSQLGNWAWQQFLNGVPEEQIWLNMYSTPEYQHRFPGMAPLRKKGRAISEAEYIGNEIQYQQIARAKGLPKGFYDTPEDFGRYIAEEVAPTEFAARVDQWVHYAYQADPIERAQLQALYPDIQPGEMAAYVMDPDRAEPLITQQFLNAQISAASVRSGYGALTLDEATRLQQMGISPDQAAQGFNQLTQQQNLFTPQIGASNQSPALTREEQMNTIFGQNATLQKQVQKRANQNKADFSGGGKVGGDRQGTGGFASASTP